MKKGPCVVQFTFCAKFVAPERECESSSVGRARPCQGRGRGFESRLSLEGRSE